MHEADSVALADDELFALVCGWFVLVREGSALILGVEGVADKGILAPGFGDECDF